MKVLYPSIIGYISLNPERVIHGEVWRLVTWIMIPPSSSNLFFLLISLYFYYVIGTVLERAWGSRFFTKYFLGGILFTILGVFIYYFIIETGSDADVINKKVADITTLFSSEGFSFNEADVLYWSSKDLFWQLVGNLFVSTYYINLSVFLAYAATYPDNIVFLLFFPVKVKALGIIYVIYYMFVILQAGRAGIFIIGASFVNFIIFYFFIKKRFRRTFKQTINAAKFRHQVNKGPAASNAGRATVKITKHKCAICGQSEETNPDLTFRFCSKCKGNYEYCQEHLFTHKHVE